MTFQVIEMHDNNDAFPILLGRPWLKMANAVINWGGQKPSITYGPEDNRVKVSIAPLSGWIREDIDPISAEEDNGGSDEKFDDTLMGVVQLNKEKAKMYSTSGLLGPSLYNQDVDVDFTYWLRQYLESISDVMMMIHSYIHQDVSREDYLSLEPCEVLTEEKWIQGGLTPWIDDVELSNVSLVHVDGTQDEEAMLKLSKL